MSTKKTNLLPKLRFPEFTEPWKTASVNSFVKRYSNPVAVKPDCMYRQIGVRSHGKGIFHKEPVTGKSLGEKRVFWVHPKAFVVNIVFAWEQAVALTSGLEDGYIASHRFPMFVPIEKKTDLNFFLLFFLRKRGKYLLELASPGGAGRNKTLGQNEFAQLDVTLPILPEQQKIAAFLGAVDQKLVALRRKRELLQIYKRSMLQKIFSQELRFKADDGTEFPEWEKKRLGDIVDVIPGLTYTPNDVVEQGILVLRSSNIQNGKVHYGDNVYVNLPATNIEMVKDGDILLCVRNGSRNLIGKSALIPCGCTNATHGAFMLILRKKNNCFVFQVLQTRYFFKKVHEDLGATINSINSSNLKKYEFRLPTHPDEQQKIADFLSAIDAKIDAVTEQIEKMNQFKKGLLQQLFV